MRNGTVDWWRHCFVPPVWWLDLNTSWQAQFWINLDNTWRMFEALL